jgi:hypothetical protein
MSTYLQKATLATDGEFTKRIGFAVAKFAKYILDEGEAAPNHRVRSRWATNAVMNSTGIAQQIAATVTLDPNVDTNLGAVSDNDLQAAVESACALLLFS